jgi:hypothetical protein
MSEFSWEELECSESEAAELDSFRRSEDSLPFGVELATWRQWVRELERGEMLTLDELESAWAIRDDVDASYALLTEDLKRRVETLLDNVDLRYRNATVHCRCDLECGVMFAWWRGRVPLGNRQRMYLGRA